MIFNSLEFALFFPIVFVIYWFVLKNKLKAQNFFLLAASYFFYGWWDWRFLSLLFLSSTIDFSVGFYLDKTNNAIYRKRLLLITVAINLFILGVFKYFNFFADSLVELLTQLNVQASFTALKIILPVGISFYTFQSMAYVIDVYRKEINASKDFISFLAFVSFFPQLVAGPIERAKHLLPQFHQHRVFKYDAAIVALRFILYGLFKKVVIADNLAIFVDEIFLHPGLYSGWTVITAVLFFAVQIYCDFSGYSDIAIGTARLLGFDLMENFRTPYFAVSLREFWQRWHISLSTWFRDYLYIPLGGSKRGEVRQYFNLLITFVISGLWHGANFTFVVWGFIHGTCVVVESFIKQRTKIVVPSFVKWTITFSIVCFAWIFFRARSWNEAILIIQSLSHGYDISGVLNETLNKVYFSNIFVRVLKACLLLFVFGELMISRMGFTNFFDTSPRLLRIGYYYLLILLIAFVGLNDNAPNFIYFKF
jgi:D-alanyl-lipoteichoic acid acyltransferase DltB (MBOAT superfamily)